MTIEKTRCVKSLSPEISQDINFGRFYAFQDILNFGGKSKTQESVDILERFSIVSKVRVCFRFALLCCDWLKKSHYFVSCLYAFFAHDVINLYLLRVLIGSLKGKILLKLLADCIVQALSIFAPS